MKHVRQIFIGSMILISILGIFYGVFTLCFGYFSSINRNKHSEAKLNFSEKRVLYVSSFNNLYDNVEKQIVGLKSVFDKADIDFDIIYMDARYYDDRAALDLFYKTLKFKLERNKKYDAIIFGDDKAIAFGEAHRSELFPTTPLFFLGVSNQRYAEEVSKNPLITGFAETSCLQDTIDIAMKFYPHARTVIAIYDDSPAGIASQNEFFAVKTKYPGYLLRGINASEMTRENLKKKISVIDKNTILICLDFREDSEGNRYSSYENTKFISKNTSVPVFTKDISSIGQGFVGGKVLDYEAMGKQTAKYVRDVLNGNVDMTAVSYFTTLDTFYLFDADILRKYDMNMRILGGDTVFVNKAMDYWKYYKEILVPFIEIAAFLLVLFLILVSYSVELRNSNRRIEFDSMHDFLTGLYNRYSIQNRLNEIIQKKIKFAVLLVDIDDLRAINDFNSHACGDFVIKELSNRLKSLSLDGNYEVSRYSGDHFLLIYKGAHLENNDPEIYFLRQLLNNAIEFEDKTLFIMTNIGIVNSNESFTVEDYLANADIAMNESKKNGRNKYIFFTDDMKQLIKKNAEIASVLEDACKNEAFTVLFQPQVDAVTEQIYGYEALVRLSHSEISPAMFIPIAEKDGHIAKIGRIVTEKVIRQMAEWRERGYELRPVSINFSAGQIGDKGYVPYLRKLMRTYEIPSEYIGIEITESLFLGNTSQASELFNQFNEIGIKIALDDFGTGYSSLNYLTHLPIDTVKLDKSIVDTYLDGKVSFIENIVNLVHSLGMKLTVEGVEARWQYEKLKSFKCDYIQGYFFSRPLDGVEAGNFIPQRVF